MSRPHGWSTTGALVGLAALAVIAALAVVAWQLRDHLAWPEVVAPVQRVLVEGPFDHVTPDEVENAVLPHIDGGFFTVDLAAIRVAAEALPWVARAQVMREWPDRVRIVVVEERAAWRWGDDGYLNERAELFVTGVADRRATLPRLDGPDGTERQLSEAYLEMDALLGGCAARVRRAELDERRAVRLTLDGGLILNLGRDAPQARARRFCDVVVGALDARFDQVAYVDMRYTNGFAVGWREGG